MRQSGLVIRLTSVLLAFFFAFSSTIVVSANDDNGYDNMTSAQKQAYLEQKIKELDQKLAGLGEQSAETEDYINTLDEKISFLQQEMLLSKSTISNSKAQITQLEQDYEANEKEIAALKEDIEALNIKNEELQSEFDTSYEEYAQRARAMYISGGTSTLEMLLTCEDISTLFTRLEMIKQVSRLDKELLEGLQKEGEELTAAKNELENKKLLLSDNQTQLQNNKELLQQTVKTLEIQQENYNEKEEAYKAQKQEADDLLLKLHKETENYSEFRNESIEELNEINAEIERAALEWQKKQEQLTATTTTTTTTTTTKPNGSEAASSTTATTPATSATKPTTASSKKLQMTYPVPSQTRITCAYGSAGYAGHTGVDFACPEKSKVVAAEDGEVIISTDLKNPDGSYRSYGRYIVIAHTKKNSSGNYVFTLYAHNSSRVVSVGQKVNKGQLIAYSGSTGNSSGPHCHFEVRTPTASYNDCVNPTPYLP